MKGGTTDGQCTVHRCAGAPYGVSGFDELDPCRVSAAGPALRGRVSRTSRGMAPRWETADRPPVHGLQKLSAPDAGRSTVLHSHLPEDLQPPSGPGAPVRHGPEQSQPVDSRPPPGAAGGVARPRRCPRPLPDRLGAAAWRVRGGRGHRRHAAGGGGPTRDCRTSHRAGVPPFAHDGTERRIVRPQDAPEQTDCYSGKKKDHTVKNVLLVNALLIILFLSATHGGRVHDLRIAEATPYPLPAGSQLLQDLGFLPFRLPEVEILMPTKKPRGQELTLDQQAANQELHCRRLRIEHVNSSVKRCRIVKDRIRLWKEGVRDLVME